MKNICSIFEPSVKPEPLVETTAEHSVKKIKKNVKFQSKVFDKSSYRVRLERENRKKRVCPPIVIEKIRIQELSGGDSDTESERTEANPPTVKEADSPVANTEAAESVQHVVFLTPEVNKNKVTSIVDVLKP